MNKKILVGIVVSFVTILIIGLTISMFNSKRRVFEQENKSLNTSSVKKSDEEIVEFAVSYYNDIKSLQNYNITVEETTSGYTWYFVMLNYKSLDNSNMMGGVQIIHNIETNKLTGYAKDTDAEEAIQNNSY